MAALRDALHRVGVGGEDGDPAALALLLGDHGVASPYRWLRALPVFGSLRVPTRYWVLVNLGVALLVAR